MGCFRLIAVASFWLAACGNIDHTFPCETHDQCVRGGIRGRCMAERYCAFTDIGCLSGMRWDPSAAHNLAGSCVGDRDASGLPSANAGENGCGGRTALPIKLGDQCGPCGAGRYVCRGPESYACEGELTINLPITSTGTVMAETTYEDFTDDYSAALVMDGNLQTSWFSAGPNQDGSPTKFRWMSPRQECISQVVVYGNGNHRAPELRRSYGFDQVTVRVLDGGSLLFSDKRLLPAASDPAALVNTGGVRGDQVLLLFEGYQNMQRGGFSELTVNAVQRPANSRRSP
jgi:hypothetical protein